jgi:hypothetical protein
LQWQGERNLGVAKLRRRGKNVLAFRPKKKCKSAHMTEILFSQSPENQRITFASLYHIFVSLKQTARRLKEEIEVLPVSELLAKI